MVKSIDDFLNFPKNFRKEEFARVFKIITRGESATLMGPSGTGKSTLLRLLVENQAIKNFHAPELEIKFAILNCEQFVGKNPLEAEGLLTKQITAEEILNFIDSVKKRVVIIIDHAENLVDGNFSGLISTLRLLRETKRDKVSLIFAFSRPINPTTDISKFGYLKPVLLENQISLSPLSQDDMNIFIDRLEEILQEKIDKPTREKIFHLSGGVMRIVKRLAKLAVDGFSFDNLNQDARLKSDLDAINDFFNKYPAARFPLPLLETREAQNPVEQIGQIKFNHLLTKQEHDLAKLLIEKQGGIVTREEMIEAVWKNKMYDVNEHALDQMLHRLRAKLESATPRCELQTLRGRGCKLEI